MMKYALNHDWKFASYEVAWLSGFLLSFNIIVVEVVNFAALLTNDTIVEAIKNFLALVVIAKFDSFFFSGVKAGCLIDIVSGADPYEKFLIIQRTTSRNAKWL